MANTATQVAPVPRVALTREEAAVVAEPWLDVEQAAAHLRIASTPYTLTTQGASNLHQHDGPRLRVLDGGHSLR
jgi:hypothetical protein